MRIVELNVKEKGRTVLPVTLQRACGFKPCDTLIVDAITDSGLALSTPIALIETFEICRWKN